MEIKRKIGITVVLVLTLIIIATFFLINFKLKETRKDIAEREVRETTERSLTEEELQELFSLASGCSETDGGKNFKVPGTTRYNDAVATDLCEYDDMLIEYYCPGSGYTDPIYYVNLPLLKAKIPITGNPTKTGDIQEILNQDDGTDQKLLSPFIPYEKKDCKDYGEDYVCRTIVSGGYCVNVSEPPPEFTCSDSDFGISPCETGTVLANYIYYLGMDSAVPYGGGPLTDKCASGFIGDGIDPQKTYMVEYYCVSSEDEQGGMVAKMELFTCSVACEGDEQSGKCSTSGFCNPETGGREFCTESP